MVNLLNLSNQFVVAKKKQSTTKKCKTTSTREKGGTRPSATISMLDSVSFQVDKSGLLGKFQNTIGLSRLQIYANVGL